MKLIICEKPSLARNIVNALPGKQEKKNGYYEVDDYIVSYAFGHLFSLKDLEEYGPRDEAKQKWTLGSETEMDIGQPAVFSGEFSVPAEKRSENKKDRSGSQSAV